LFSTTHPPHIHHHHQRLASPTDSGRDGLSQHHHQPGSPHRLDSPSPVPTSGPEEALLSSNHSLGYPPAPAALSSSNNSIGYPPASATAWATRLPMHPPGYLAAASLYTTLYSAYLLLLHSIRHCTRRISSLPGNFVARLTLYERLRRAPRSHYHHYTRRQESLRTLLEDPHRAPRRVTSLLLHSIRHCTRRICCCFTLYDTVLGVSPRCLETSSLVSLSPKDFAVLLAPSRLGQD
jgi:hypothetical protein